MKIKSFVVFFVFCLMVVVIPCSLFAHENVASFKHNNITYELFSNGTAKISSIENEELNGGLSVIFDSVLYNNEEYKITSIGSNVLSTITENQELHMYLDTAPNLESGNSFSKITAIYIPIGAQGYTEENGWPTEKLKHYKIDTQPQDIVVTAGEIKDTDILKTSASIPISAGSIIYEWYSCDKDGNILNDTPISNYADFAVPSDLTYDNENNKAKDHYFVCVIGQEGNILETTRVAKVTVNPGVYKVTFNTSWFPGDSTDSITVAVNSQRKLTATEVPTIEQLELTQKGFVFLGWSIDIHKKNIIDPLKVTFDKNTTIYPIWQIKISFDTNGGAFADGSKIYSVTSTNYDFEIYDLLLNIQEPKREGYEFLGFFDKKIDGKSLHYYMAEDGFNTSTTFYAQWKSLANDENNINNENKNDNNSDMTNPQTGDNIFVVVSMILIAGVVTLATIKFSKSYK